MPVGTITRGTTNTNRLRRVDRWVSRLPVLRTAPHPLVVDLGFGASAVTTLELHERLAKVRTDVEVLGLEIDPSRVRRATEQLSATPARAIGSAGTGGVSFGLGGFEVPMPGRRTASVIRALNVLRQYDEQEVTPAWRMLVARLAPDGVLVDGTCDEIGRIASWVAVTPSGPQSFTISLRLAGLDRPSVAAERLPKILIHRNVPGEPVHDLLQGLDRQWQHHSALGAYGPTQRWLATVAGMKEAGWPVQGGTARWRLGEITLPWVSVMPSGFTW